MNESVVAGSARLFRPSQAAEPMVRDCKLLGAASLIAARLVAVFKIAGSGFGRSVLRWFT
jgi:hypothetical protein